MQFNAERQPRKKLRLPGYDYRKPGYYYITLCTNNRDCLFGEISNDKMCLNAAGQMVLCAFNAIPDRYCGWFVDCLIVMPNHVHAILVFSRAGPARGPAPTIGSTQESAPTLSLPELMRNIKSYTTTCYRHGVRLQKWPSFYGSLWQRSYYDHVIRNGTSLEKIRQYILDNPIQWAVDKNNPMFQQ